VTLCSVILMEHRLVADRQRNGQTNDDDDIYHASITSRGKKDTT